MIKRTTIIETVSVLNIILFLYAAVSKTIDYTVFKEQLVDSPILGFAGKPIAILLPIAEFIIVLQLIVPRWRLKGLCQSASLMIAFTGYIIAMFIVSPRMPCSCGGVIEMLSWQEHIAFNAAFVLINLWAIILLKKETKTLQREWRDESVVKLSHEHS